MPWKSACKKNIFYTSSYGISEIQINIIIICFCVYGSAVESWKGVALFGMVVWLWLGENEGMVYPVHTSVLHIPATISTSFHLVDFPGICVFLHLDWELWLSLFKFRMCCFFSSLGFTLRFTTPFDFLFSYFLLQPILHTARAWLNNQALTLKSNIAKYCFWWKI